ncbi:hypothetical protein GYMLUDRAFT_55708 [Collybiopsis luxurians FD-317 M1]|nr:hypothetical protein GYMLUDRAFT_55708 [Collybiopsis luxurians FD-317 M1]
MNQAVAGSGDDGADGQPGGDSDKVSSDSGEQKGDDKADSGIEQGEKQNEDETETSGSALIGICEYYTVSSVISESFECNAGEHETLPSSNNVPSGSNSTPSGSNRASPGLNGAPPGLN